MRSIACIIIFYLMFVMPVKAQDSPPDPDRYPAGHFLDHRPLAKGFGTAKRLRSPPSGIRSSTSAPEQAHERVWGAIKKPATYIAGRLICALNVNAALAEHGISGPGGADSKAFRTWGRPSSPKPLAVAFNYRRGGGHVSIVSHVDEQGRVWVWNPSPRGRGWQLRINRYASTYRAAS